jgi:hypothetical protein
VPWFMVDDGFWSHPKTLQLSDGAQALWMRAGSWSMKHLTDGFVPDFALPILSAKPRFVNELRTVSLWFRVEDGYQFHDWKRYQRSRADIEEEREKNAERKRRSRGESRRDSRGDSGRNHGGTQEAQSSPVPALPVNTLNNVSHLPEREAEIDVEKVIVAVQKNCGRECGVPGAYLIIGTVMDRAKTRPKNKTAFVVRAIERDPFEFQKILDEAVA